ncbi:YceI family protein [Roseospira visakhapatnamensis]|uniref:Polyisoprenoid-binding protein YceI n=1 Tax=Roseospira visakhapatnamensis TaxID=390880 RepID=A0A7W6RBG4_9PROT|nr:YceI family protein [Roseospira visakhapatnamensis]MBB4265387.1 polyisoprenoid-binding protein YceI [Roseospira visakhapatnamensis]
MTFWSMTRRRSPLSHATAIAPATRPGRRLRPLLPTGPLALSLALLWTLTTAQAAHAAGWTLDPDASTLSFGSIKAGHIGEVHEFRALSGTVDDSGAVDVVIDLASVSTGIDLRDDRMRDMLFNVATFPVARITAQVPVSDLADLPVGESVERDVTAKLSLMGEAHDLPLPLAVTRLSENRILVRPLRLVMVQADDYAVAEGIEKLRAVAGLDQISMVVPATFAATFVRGE